MASLSKRLAMPRHCDALVADVAVATALPVDAVEEGVDEHVADTDAQSCEEALHALTRLPDEDAAADRLVRRRVLADDEHAGRAVEIELPSRWDAARDPDDLTAWIS